MEELIENLITAIKKDDRYINFQLAERKLQDSEVSALLEEYHRCFETYQDVKQYEPYISSDEEKQKWLKTKKKLAHHPKIQQYYQNYYELNELLTKVTSIIFQDISDEIILGK